MRHFCSSCRRKAPANSPPLVRLGGSCSLDVPVSFVASLLFLIIIVFGLSMVAIRLIKSGWGPYILQAPGLLLLVPAILVLAAFELLSDEIIPTLPGAVVGYVFGLGG